MQVQDLTPLGAAADEYLTFKKKRLTEASARGYRAALDELARFYPDLQISAFEPPAGTMLLENFLTALWGQRSARTYNKNLSIVHDFFVWQIRRGRLRGDPSLFIERAKARSVFRTTFSAERCAAIIAANQGLRDRLALRLLLDYGIRKGALQNVQLEHFDAVNRRLMIFTKGEKWHQLPIPDPGFWADLAQLAGEPGCRPADYLLPKRRVVTRRRRPEQLLAQLQERLVETIAVARELEQETDGAVTRPLALLEAAAELARQARPAADVVTRQDPARPMGEHGLHDWWYRCLIRAGIVPEGTSSGERMHKARHSAGQRLLNATGNLRSVQKLLGHASTRTTEGYTDWDIDQLADDLLKVVTSTGAGRDKPE